MKWILCFVITTLNLLISPIICAVLPNKYRSSKLSLADSAEWTEYYIREPEGPGTYSFGYDVEDSLTGNVQFRTEERRSNGTVTGSYGYVTPEGSVHVVHYVADHLGYRTKIEDGKLIRPPNKKHKSEDSQEDISPQMFAALQSLGNNNLFQKEDQRLRPINNIKSVFPIKEKRNEANIIYKVQHVPSNLKENI